MGISFYLIKFTFTSGDSFGCFFKQLLFLGAVCSVLGARPSINNDNGGKTFFVPSSTSPGNTLKFERSGLKRRRKLRTKRKAVL